MKFGEYKTISEILIHFDLTVQIDLLILSFHNVEILI